MRSAAAGLFRVHWSPDVLDEVRRTLVNQISIEEARAQHLLAAMRRAFPDAEVHGYHSLIGDMSVVDPEDRHVLAAAVVARADVIITRNVRHFPSEETSALGIEVQSPDTFLVDLLHVALEEVSSVVVGRARDLGDSVPETLDFLRRHVPRFVEALESTDSFRL